VDWDEHAAGWDDDAVVRVYAAAAFDALVAQLTARGRSLAGLRVLDFGCGTGVLTESLAPACNEVVALDASPKMIAVLREKIDRSGWANVRAIDRTLEAALEAGELTAPFDVVVCSSVCAFVDDYPGTARQLAALLAPGGVFVQFDWELDDAADDPFGLSKAQVKAALTDARLDDIHVGIAFTRDIEGQAMQPLIGVGQRRSAG